MKLLFFLFIFFLPLKPDIREINSIQMGDDLEKYLSDLQMLTGTEPFYDRNPGLKKIMQQKQANNLKEGFYVGNELNVLDKYKAGRMNFFFYKDELYKVTWSFRYAANMPTLSKNISDFLTSKFGPPQEQSDMMILQITTWTDGKNLIRSVQDNSEEFSLEFSDVKVSEEVEAITKKFE